MSQEPYVQKEEHPTAPISEQVLATVRRSCRACNARMGHPLTDADLDDIIQEVQVAYWRKRATFEGRSSIESWIYGVARLAILHKRRTDRRRTERVSALHETELGAAEIQNASESAVGTGLRRAIRDCLGMAGSTVALIVRERSLSQKSFRDIGAQLGRSEVAVKARYYRALPRLRERLSQAWLEARR